MTTILVTLAYHLVAFVAGCALAGAAAGYWGWLATTGGAFGDKLVAVLAMLFGAVVITGALCL